MCNAPLVIPVLRFLENNKKAPNSYNNKIMLEYLRLAFVHMSFSLKRSPRYEYEYNFLIQIESSQKRVDFFIYSILFSFETFLLGFVRAYLIFMNSLNFTDINHSLIEAILISLYTNILFFAAEFEPCV